MGRFALTSPAAPGSAGAQASWSEEGVAQTTAAAIVGTTTLVEDDSGGVFTLSQAAAYTVTLPDPTIDGLRFNFLLLVPGANTVVINTPAGSIEGTINRGGVAVTLVATGTNINFLTGAAAIGDSLELYTVGGIWLARAVSSNAAGISAS